MRQDLFFLLVVPFFLLNIFKTAAQEIWTEKTKMPISRTQAMGFAIGDKGYIVCGLDKEIDGSDELWEWNQATNTWTQKASLPGSPRYSGVAFAIGNKGYVGMGYEFGFYADLWEWDQANDTWTPMANFPGVIRGQAMAFTIGNKAYIAGGFTDNYQNLKDLWEWNQTTDTWTQKADMPEALSASGVFTIGSKGYIVTGNTQASQSTQLWEWDQTNDTWTERAELEVPRAGAGSFSIGNKGYVVTGEGDVYHNDAWEWDQATDTWTQIADFPTTARARVVSFSIANKGYILGGANGPFIQHDEIWELEIPISTSINHSLALDERPVVSPNPCHDFIQLQFDQGPELLDLQLTDLLGRRIDLQALDLTTEENISQLNTQSLATGIYLLTVQTEQGVYSEQIVVQ